MLDIIPKCEVLGTSSPRRIQRRNGVVLNMPDRLFSGVQSCDSLYLNKRLTRDGTMVAHSWEDPETRSQCVQLHLIDLKISQNEKA